MSLLYINLVPSVEQDDFENKVISVANDLGIANPNWLMQIMKAESGLRADIVNPKGGAIGLIQFMPRTAKGLGTTTDTLRNMSRVDQMDYVEKYLQPYAGRLNSYFDLYLVVFFPAAIGNTDNDDYIFESSDLSAAQIAAGNPTMDINKDGKITMGEFKQYLQNTVAAQYFDEIFNTIYTTPVNYLKKHPWIIGVFAVLAMGMTFAIIYITTKTKNK